MDAALVFLIVFVIYSVMLAVTLTKHRALARDHENLRGQVEQLRGVVLSGARVTRDVANDAAISNPQPTADDLQVLMSNPLVQQFMSAAEEK